MTPHLPVARSITEPESAYDVAYFERFYAGRDPWRLADNPNERQKYSLTLELCGPGPFDHALEVGCGEGLFTELLAPRCGSLLSIDISSRAIGRAAQRLSSYPGVRFQATPLPANWPAGPFDLVVASDVLYFWPSLDLWNSVPRIQKSLAPGGRFVAIHFAGPIKGVNDGRSVHDTLSRAFTLSHIHSETCDIGPGRPYRVDVWEQTTPTVSDTASLTAAAAT